MSTSQRTFDQVKNILGKLDREIDAARAKRLQTRTGAPSGAAPAAPTNPAPAPSPAPTATPASPTPAARHGYGRAQPMRPNGGPPPHAQSA